MNWDIDTPEGMQNAKNWLSDFLQRMKEGAVWGIPRTLAFYRFFKSSRTAVRLDPKRFDTSTERVLKELGWTVIIGN